jgi:hypothetical protein
MPDEKRQNMNYRKGDDLIHGPMGARSELEAGERQTVILPEQPVRRKLGPALKERSCKSKHFGRCNLHVLTVASLTPDQADRLLTDNIDGVDFSGVQALNRAVVNISYPLKHTVEVTIEPGTRGGEHWMTVGYILWQVARAYRQIYDEEAVDGRHGVWGHCLRDLFFECIRPHDESGYCELAIGS